MADTKKTVKIKCKECGKEFEANSSRASLCSDCKKKKAAARRRQRQLNKPKTPIPENILKAAVSGNPELDSLFPPEIWEQRPVDIDTFLFDRNYLGNAWSNRKGEKTIFPAWEEIAHKVFPLPMRSPYHTIILSGATGLGKTSFAMGVLCAYYLHIVLCLRNPHEYFDLADQKNIVFAVLNIVTKAMAFKNAWGIISKMLLRSPWFMARGESTGGRRPEWFCTTKPVELIYGRNANDLIGLDILFAFMDEVSFARNRSVERQIEIAEEVFDAALERMKSRFTKFGGIYEGLMCMASSKRTDMSFLETFTKKLTDSFDSNRVLVIDKPRWEILPPESYCGEVFPVAVGDKFKEPKILTEDEVEAAKEEGYQIIWPPIEYKADFERNIIKALTNIAGLSVSQISGFLSGVKVAQAINKSLQNPFTQSIIYVGNNDNHQYWEYFDLSRVRPEDFAKPMAVHLDASLGGDGNSISGTVADYATMQADIETGDLAPQLHYRQVFKVKVKAPPKDKVMLSKNYQFIIWLVQQGFNIIQVSSDQYQSKQFGQDLTKQGINYKEQSIDKVVNGINPTYEVLERALYEGRLELLDDEDQTRELVCLEKHESGRVDKPAGGSDDASQALCGSVYGCSQFKEEVLHNGSVLIKALDSSEGRAPTQVDIQKELERHLSSYSPDAIVVNQESTLKKDLEKFFGKEPEKKEKKNQSTYTGYWG